MHVDHSVFLEALASRQRLSVRFVKRDKEQRGATGLEMTRVCAPLDFGPLRGAKAPDDVYQLWDLEAKRKPLNLVLSPDEVLAFRALPETFDPADIITWAFKPHAWHVARDWGAFS